MNLGDFVKHTRQGPGRITQILPEYIEVKSPAGHVYKVSRAVADLELVPVPPDGFAALLATRQPTSDYLLENIVDVTRRLFRDRRNLSISKNELRQELEPFLKREGKSYAGWWKRAQKRLLDSGIVVTDPNKKTNLVLAGEISSRASTDWVAELTTIRTGSELLDYARRVYAAGNEGDRVTKAAEAALDRFARHLLAGDESARERLEILLALCYLGPRLDQTARNRWLNLLEAINPALLPTARDLDDDLAAAVGLVAKATPRKAAEWATVLLAHPSTTVTRRAFVVLNTDRFRLVLKKPLLEWLRSPDSVPPHNLDLYLDEAFLSYLRSEDKAALFVQLSKQATENRAVRKFLANPAYARAAAEMYSNNAAAALQAVSGRTLDERSRSHFIEALGPDAVLEQVLRDCQPQLAGYLSDAIASSSSQALLSHSTQLINVLKAVNNSETTRAASRRITALLQELGGVDLLRAATLGCELNALSNERDASLDRAIESAFSKLASDSAGALTAFTASVQAQIASVTSELTDRLREAEDNLSTAAQRYQTAEKEVERLRSVLEIVKTSAGEEKVGSKHRALREFITSLLPVVDEMQRRSQGGNEAARQLHKDIVAAFEQAGLVQIGSVGEVQAFEPQRHMLLQDQAGSVHLVAIVRSGYLLMDGDDTVVIRHALVRPVEERAR